MGLWIRAEIGENTRRISCGPAAVWMVPVMVVYEVDITLPSQGRGNALGLDLFRRFCAPLSEEKYIHKYVNPLGFESYSGMDLTVGRVSIFNEFLLLF
jgi:hypothetical protein